MPRRISHACLSSALPLALGCALFMLCTAAARAQQPPEVTLPPLPAPPPMKYVPDAARDQLGAARDAKARTRLSIELAEARLSR